jgi:hypothetical protein
VRFRFRLDPAVWLQKGEPRPLLRAVRWGVLMLLPPSPSLGWTRREILFWVPVADLAGLDRLNCVAVPKWPYSRGRQFGTEPGTPKPAVLALASDNATQSRSM